MTVDFIRLNEFWYAAAAAISYAATGILTDRFLTCKYTKAQRTAGWSVGTVVYFLYLYAAFCISASPALYDLFLFLGWMVLLPVMIEVMYRESHSTKFFTAVSGVFIANVCSFISGSTTSLLIRDIYPWGEDGYRFIMPFAGVKLVVTSIVVFVLIRYTSRMVREVFEIMDGRMKRFIAIPLVASIGFFCIVNIVQKYGLVVSEGMFFASFFFIICGTFGLMYWLIFSNILWSSRAMKTQAELNVASNIQRDMLPRIFPFLPERPEFDLYATMDPAKEVGGDFYDYFMVDDDHLAIVIGDVSGKGVPAALFMVISKTLIKNYALMGLAPDEVFTRANNDLCEGNEAELFTTAWLGIYEISTGRLLFADAGHDTPIRQKADGSVEYIRPVKKKLVLAGMEDLTYVLSETRIEPGELVLIYTDGVPEATNGANELFGQKRLEQSVKNYAKDTPKELLTHIRADVDAFVGEVPQFDDLTMLALKITDGAAK